MDIEAKFHEFKDLVKKAGESAYEYFDSDDRRNELKADGTAVTAIDRQIEATLVAYIRKNFPDDSIRGEEHGGVDGTSGYIWHIDPIDGTDNFLRKIPFCATSVARLGDTSEGSFGIVYNPITKQAFSSFMETPGGVYENERLQNLTADTLGGKFVIGFGRGTYEPWMKPASFALKKEIGMKYGRCEAYGSTALELAYVAANRIDGFLTYGLKSWDYAGGLFLVKAAGGAISVFENGSWQLWDSNLKELCAEHGKTIFVSHPDVHQQFLTAIGNPRDWATK